MVSAKPAAALMIRLAMIAIVATITLLRKKRGNGIAYQASTKKKGCGSTGQSDGGYAKMFSPVTLVLSTQ